MRTVFGITVPDSGTVTWNGQPITQEERRRFGYLPEERGLYPAMRVQEQLEYLGALHGMTRSDAAAEATRWLETLGLSARANDKVETLSLGNQQRVQLAAALIHRPELLVLDEPFSGLDPVGVETMAAVLASQAAAGVTVLFSSHQLDLVEHYCREVAIIDHGRLVASGPVSALTVADPPVLEVSVDAPTDWVSGLKGVKIASQDASVLRLLISPGVDPTSVLRAAMKAGTVTHFSFERRRLSEVFLDAVSAA
jgi:ABC-2 type transport system ATP-binding protein